MTLSTIKFNYQNKIDKLNARIGRYQEIIEDYNVRINEAEKEDNPNISSVLNSKEQYEHKIENMERVKAYYQEFVDTADYLLQNINNFDGVIEHSKIEGLEKENIKLKEDIAGLDELVYSQSNKITRLESKINNFEIIESVDNNRIKELRKKIKGLRKQDRENTETIKNLRQECQDLKGANNALKSGKKSSELRKANKEIRQLTDEIQSLKGENYYLERRNQQLEDYCNHLLSRGTDEPLQMGVKISNNIFNEIRQGGK